MLSPGRLRFECPLIDEIDDGVTARGFLSSFCPLTKYLPSGRPGGFCRRAGQNKDSFRITSITGSEIASVIDPFAGDPLGSRRRSEDHQ
ncbi:hypothetical protein [Amycolatopsis sp. lyj-112]|uniref:hypothetical protein n=1 Tax=Amycolatopsis sp. lyj-112 TaxID=2789288 RepID=UPI00397862AB